MAGYCTFFSLGRYGRFANQIFQIAGTIGIARKNGLEPVFPEWKNYDHKDRFGSTEDIDVQKYFVNPLPIIPEYGPIWNEINIPWGYHDIVLHPDRNYTLAGHMQSLRYFEHCIDEVRHYMKMVDEAEAGSRGDTVAMHVRLGDYDGNYHPRLGIEYYAKALNEFPGCKVEVFTDDVEGVKAMLIKHYHPAYVADRFSFAEGSTYLEDFRELKTYSNYIIGNSSFSAAAAILSEAPNKKVVAPLTWFGPAYEITGKDIYCNNWILI